MLLIKQTSYCFINNEVDNIPLKLPSLAINDVSIKQVIATKFLGVHIHDNLNCLQHITLTENKISKQRDILYETKHLNRKSMVSLYYLFIPTYLSYSNIEWARKVKLKLS